MSDNPSAPRIAYITAGAAGMYCGSCLHDNTLARALSRQGVDIQLIPTYTPIRTDEEDVSVDRVFYGGINVYLEQRIPLYRFVAPVVGRLLDQRWMLKWAVARQLSLDASALGSLTVSMLRGTAGHQRAEVRRLCSWLVNSLRPDLINFSNILICGCLPLLKSKLSVPMLVTLQGDDIFLESIEEPYRSQALKEIRGLIAHVDGFLVHSEFYAEFMSEYLQIPRKQIHVVPLGIDVSDFEPKSEKPAEIETINIGYLARLAPEKGLHLLVDAFIELHKRYPSDKLRLLIAGWLGTSNQEYARQQFEKLRSAGLSESYEYVGAVDRSEKIRFLHQLDLFSVPTTYREPKGLFVLEALAAGVPVVQPAHGAFPELIEILGGGRLVAPNNPVQLADSLADLIHDGEARRTLAQAGCAAVHADRNADAMARATLEQLLHFLPNS